MNRTKDNVNLIEQITHLSIFLIVSYIMVMYLY